MRFFSALRLSVALASLSLGAVACVPSPSGGGEGAVSGNQTSVPVTQPNAGGWGAENEPCFETVDCEAGLVCLPINVQTGDSACLRAVVHGVIEGALSPGGALSVKLLMLDPPAAMNPDGVLPAESYSEVGTARTSSYGDFGFFSNLDEGTYRVSVTYGNGQWGQTAALSRDKLTAGSITVTVR